MRQPYGGEEGAAPFYCGISLGLIRSFDGARARPIGV